MQYTKAAAITEANPDQAVRQRPDIRVIRVYGEQAYR